MNIGSYYDIVFSTGKYDINYESGVKYIKKTPKSYRLERKNGTTFLVRQDGILELKRVSGFDN